MASKAKREMTVTVSVKPTSPDDAARRLRALARLLLQPKPAQEPDRERPDGKRKS